MHDIIVVGGGPAGMTAALYARRNGKTVLVIERNGFGGQITHSPRVENYPGFESVSGNELAERLLDQILAQGAEIELENVISIEDMGDRKAVKTETGNVFEARAVILANGVKHRMLGLPGEQELIGEGISFCAVCDGDFYSGKKVCVAGGGNSALQEAILLSELCCEVIILQDLPVLTGEMSLQNILGKRENVTIRTGVRITGFETEDGSLSGVRIRTEGTDSECIPCDGLFEAIGLIPENERFSNVAPLDQAGYYQSDESCLTNSSRIYVAGDCRAKNVRQITTAAADGAVAALAACRALE